jgi:hypothetical protein
VKRILIAATLAAVLAPAATASGQGAPPPPGQTSIIAVRVGSTLDKVPCQIAFRRTLIAPGRPWQPGDPPDPIYADAIAPIDPNACRGLQPVVLRRARHMTVTLLGQSPQVGATWFGDGRPTPLVVRPVGEPPTAIWFLRLPLTSGKLVLHMWYPVRTSVRGEVTQDRTDYKLAIRRKVQAVPAPRPTEPPVADPVIPIDSTPPQPAAPEAGQ